MNNQWTPGHITQSGLGVMPNTRYIREVRMHALMRDYETLWAERDRIRTWFKENNEYREGAAWAEQYFMARGGEVVSRQTHNLETGGANPSPASNLEQGD